MKKIILTIFLAFFFIGCFENTTVTTDRVKASIAKDSVPMLVILLSYKNIKILYAPSVWENKLFGEHNHQLNHYYLENSCNNFKFTKADIIPVTLDKNHPNIDIDKPYFTNKVYPDFAQALRMVDDKIDFSNYDKDANGYITPNELVITYIVAGYEDAYEGYHVNNGIWAHQSCMANEQNVVELDGVSLLGCNAKGNFAVFGELHDKNKPHIATIGIIAHELAHSTFDLPDLYNTFNPNSGGIGYFGIMCSGTWGVADSSEYPGETPSHFCAWSKIHNGWVVPIEYKDEFVTLYESSSPEYNVLKIPIDEQNYYLVENRNNSGYDRGLQRLSGDFKGGLAIWKIDESKLTQSRITDNTVNVDTYYKGVDLVEAVKGNIDSTGGGGAENALYYKENVDYFLNYITNISSRGSKMTLTVKDY